jgi:hypothetical protein
MGQPLRDEPGELDMSDICDRLRDAHDGWSGDACCVSAEVAAEAAQEIERLRATVYGQGARLDQLHSIVGAAMAEPLVTFSNIKKEIRNG